MKLGIIVGSQRLNSQSLRISQFIEEHLTLKSTDKDKIETYFLDLPKEDLPRLHSYSANMDETWRMRWMPISKELHECDAFIIVSPEWNGGATPTIKNFFLLTSDFELAHKPALIVSTSSGHGGSFTVGELRGYSYKNTMINYIPEHIIIRQCQSMLLAQEILPTDGKADIYIKKRINFATNLLIDYAKMLKPIREGGIPLFELSPHGMS
jgi:NAD(P)H-dependent FMN reductase